MKARSALILASSTALLGLQAQALPLFTDDFTQAPIDSGWIEVENIGNTKKLISLQGGTNAQFSGGGSSGVTESYILRRFDFSAATGVSLNITASDGGGFNGNELFTVRVDRGDGNGLQQIFQDNGGLNTGNISINAATLDVDELNNVLLQIATSANVETYFVNQVEFDGAGSVGSPGASKLVNDPFDDLSGWTAPGVTVDNGRALLGDGQEGIITRAVDTTGFDNITVRMTGQLNPNTSYEFFGSPTDDYDILYDLGDGNGFQLLRRDPSFSGGNVVDFGYFLLPDDAADNPDLQIRLRGHTNVGAEDIFIDDFIVAGLPLPVEDEEDGAPVVPEPATAALAAAGLLGLMRRRR